MIWRLVAGGLLVALVVTTGAMVSTALPGRSDWDRIAGDHRFNILRWESQNLLGKWSNLIRETLTGGVLAEDDKIPLVEQYLALGREIASLSEELERTSGMDGPLAETQAVLEGRLASLVAERQEMEDRVEEIVEGQMSSVLADEGLAGTLSLGGQVELLFPPVDFEFEARPNVLIVSHRAVIEIVDTTLLNPDMTLDDKSGLEKEVEHLGYSALVEQVGAVATYPSIVPPTTTLMNLLSKAGHEWMHHYLFFRPLGQRYWSSYEMTTINETAADVVGAEIASLTFDRYYRGEPEERPQDPPGNTSSFDFAGTMRETRLEVDRLLLEGDVEGAERYMEEQRRFLQDNGYYLRKLNQAYFAFHGTYAGGPTSVDPIGDQMRELRERSDSLGAFIRSVSRISDHEMLLRALADGEA
jgi:hypothetical protein